MSYNKNDYGAFNKLRYGLYTYNYTIDNADASKFSLTDNLFVRCKMDISYNGYENGKQVLYKGNFVKGTVPTPARAEGRVQSSGNARGTLDAQYRSTGKTPNISAVPRYDKLFPYGADWSLSVVPRL